MAEALAKALSEATGSAGGLVHDTPCSLLKSIAMPGALIEVGFLTNAAEAERLASEAHQIRLAQGIVAGLKAYAAAVAAGIAP